ncbi:hypothetical protein AMTR_s00036p00214160 [Amborella trichopoda]|uniref:Pentatricopeptide repeat-containing protein n=1 Tax=Amborella trichopoda TaxID=13333 RepID=U5D4Z0_AMBTC|nr:hypothetical protein AMTR_s00036p00214160 [Amborella trichopoda]
MGMLNVVMAEMPCIYRVIMVNASSNGWSMHMECYLGTTIIHSWLIYIVGLGCYIRPRDSWMACLLNFVSIWRSFMWACHLHGDVKMTMYAMDPALELQPLDNATFTLMFTVYCRDGMWEEANKLRKGRTEE